MWQYIFLMVYRQRGRSILASGGFFLAACALILLSATTQTTVLQANQIINQNWRPTYDLVVLPPQVNIPSGKAVPADLLEGYNGGISLQQYYQIKHLPGVEVAAPIAYLGYAHLPSPLVQFSAETLTPGYYRLNWLLTAFNGQRQIVERQVSVIYYVLSSCDSLNSQPSFYDALDKQNVQFGACGPMDGPISLSSIDTGTFLLAAIDPDAENQLVHLDKSIVSGRMLTSGDTLRRDAHIPSINDDGKNVPIYDLPMLFAQHLPGQITLHATFSRLTSDAIDPQQVLNRGGFKYLAHFSNQEVFFNGSVPLLQNDPQRFSSGILQWNGSSWQSMPYTQAGSYLSFLYTPSELTYRPTTAPDGQSVPAYTLIPSNTQNAEGALRALHLLSNDTAAPDSRQGPEVAFRSLQPLHTLSETPDDPYTNTLYASNSIGEFDGSRLSAQFSDLLNWLPETTYASSPVVLRYDAQGRPITSANLVPTTNQAGFTLQPPLALTTLAAAEQIKGQNIISVIRVRVAGVNTADQASWKRVEQVAQMIQQRTGLRVLVTLGSSPQPTLVYVPGIKRGQDGSTRTIGPLGWIEERWIYIGAGIVYLTQLGETRLLLLATVLLVCLGYLIVTLSTLAASQRKEMAVLSALGWRPGQSARMFLGQALMLAIGGGIGGMGMALLVIILIKATPVWDVVIWALPIVLVLALLSALYPYYQIWHIHPAEVLRTGTTITTERSSRLVGWQAQLRSRLPGISAMALRNLARSRLRAIIALGSLFLSAILLTIMIDGLLAFRQTLQGTLLGDYVLLQTAVPQLAGATFAVLLTFLSVADLLLLQVKERQKEIGLLQAVGWRSKIVQRLFVQEGLALALGGAIPGACIALWVLLALHTAQSTISAPLVATGTVALMLAVAGLATIPAIRAINRLPLMDVLRAE